MDSLLKNHDNRKHPEFLRLEEREQKEVDWNLWGSYLSDRQWGTVREDYSHNGDAWSYCSYFDAAAKTYRWGEDGILGISDKKGLCCFAPTFWNGQDKLLKERLFGLSNQQGNHGEDLKEYFFHLENTPTHSLMRGLYKYPQAAFPYEDLIRINGERTRNDPEYELLDTGIFDQGNYFDIFVLYAKASPAEILITIEAINRSTQEAPLYLLPTLWFRNTWSWGKPGILRPVIERQGDHLLLQHDRLGTYYFYAEEDPSLGFQRYLFTENETNEERLYGKSSIPSLSQEKRHHFKDGFHRYLVEQDKEAVKESEGTKVAPLYHRLLQGGESWKLRFCLKRGSVHHTLVPATTAHNASVPPTAKKVFGPNFQRFEEIFAARQEECDTFYQSLTPHLNEEEQQLQKKALSGLLWCKKFYHYSVMEWLRGDVTMPPPPPERWKGRNNFWKELYAEDIISMPDSWEYPYFCSWDLMFQTLPFTLIDPEMAKEQNMILKQEHYTAPSAQQPGYEWALSDSNPPVDAWSIWKIYSLDKAAQGKGDRLFLRHSFDRLLLSYAWWANRVDHNGEDVFEGGFLGLDNISVFDRRYQLSDGSKIMQSDGTAWMSLFSLSMLQIALELMPDNTLNEGVANKFLTDFVYLTANMNNIGSGGYTLWDHQDGFYYDVIKRPDGSSEHLKVRSVAGLTPLFVTALFSERMVEKMEHLLKNFDWFHEHRPELMVQLQHVEGLRHGCKMISLVPPDRVKRICHRLFDEEEFLSPYGIRALSRYYEKHPYSFTEGNQTATITYSPAESPSSMFGGNSNWRGPIWFPMNYLIIESLQKFGIYYGDSLRVEFPTRSGNFMNLWEISIELQKRLTSIFLKDPNGKRPCYGDIRLFQEDPHWNSQILFNEYFHGNHGKGLGASHQTGWTALIAMMLHELGKLREDPS